MSIKYESGNIILNILNASFLLPSFPFPTLSFTFCCYMHFPGPVCKAKQTFRFGVIIFTGPCKENWQFILKKSELPSILGGVKFYSHNLGWSLQDVWLSSDCLLVRWCSRKLRFWFQLAWNLSTVTINR